MTKPALLKFLRLHRYGVEASHAAEGPPQAALVGITVNERFELFFDSFDSTRKVSNLHRNPHIAFVIGGYELADARTVQYEGEVDSPTGAELEHFKNDYFAIHPDGLRRSKLPGITYFRVRARWIRYTNFNVAPAEIVVFEGADLGSGDNAPASPTVGSYMQMKEPWQPKSEREPEFNAYANPRARAGDVT